MNFTITNIFCGSAGLGALFGFSTRFMTSLEVIRKVMNVPMEAVVSIARDAGLDVMDCHSECIEENSLGPFADAYVRKMKYYFTNSLREISQLDYDEFRTFHDFCKTFKKSNVKTAGAVTWDDIDQDAIREQFYAELKKNTREKKHDGLFASHKLFSDSLWRTIDYHSCTNDLEQFEIEQQAYKVKVLESVVNSRLYHTRKKAKSQKQTSSYAHNIIRIMLLSARYHLCGDDGKDDGVHIVEKENIMTNYNLANNNHEHLTTYVAFSRLSRGNHRQKSA